MSYNVPQGLATDLMVALDNYVPAYTAGTGYTLTGSSAQVMFTGGGAVSPVVTLPETAKYNIEGSFTFELAGLSVSVGATISFKLRRINNTAADLANSTKSLKIPIAGLSVVSGSFDTVIKKVRYQATAGDQIALFANYAGVTLGTILIPDATLFAQRAGK